MAQPKTAADPPKLAKTLRQLAQYLNRPETTLRKWAARSDWTWSRPPYPIDDVAEWIRVVIDAPPPTDAAASAEKILRLRVLRAKAQKLELDVQAQREELVERTAVEAGLMRRIYAVKVALADAAEHIAREAEGLDRAGILAAVQRQHDQILNDFAEGRRQPAAPPSTRPSE